MSQQSRPVYLKLRDLVAAAIIEGRYREGEMLPSVRALAAEQGANPLTLMGLAGLGDLVATCSSPLSRNRTFGERLGQAMTTEEIYATTKQVAEGAKSCKSLLALARANDVDAPIAEHVDAVVDGRMTAQDMMNSFSARDTKPELH